MNGADEHPLHRRALSVLQGAGIRRDVNCVVLEHGERNNVQSSLMGRRQHHWCSSAVVVGAQPVRGSYAPAIPWLQPGKTVLRHRRAQVIANTALVLQELTGHDRAYRMAPQVLGTGAAAPVSVETRDRVGPARLELAAQHIAIAHPSSIGAQAALLSPGGCQKRVRRRRDGLHVERPGLALPSRAVRRIRRIMASLSG